MEGVATRGW